jgi:hypothetical protein
VMRRRGERLERGHERARGARTTVAPYFSLARTCWIPAVYAWDAETGEFRRIEGPLGFAAYRQAVEASRFLARRMEEA